MGSDEDDGSVDITRLLNPFDVFDVLESGTAVTMIITRRDQQGRLYAKPLAVVEREQAENGFE